MRFTIIPIEVYDLILLRFKETGCKLNKDKLFFIIDLIIRLGRKQKSDSVRITKEILRLYISDYKKYFTWLESENIIKSERSYLAGSFAQSHELSKDLYSLPIQIPITDFKLLQRIKKQSALNHEVSTAVTTKNFKFLKGFWESGLLRIDLDGVDYTINEIKKSGKISEWAEICWRQTVIRIDSKDYNFSIDNTSNRLHTPLTTLKKELRNHLTYNNQKLVESDIKNSQSFFASLLLSIETLTSRNVYDVVKSYNQRDKQHILQLINKVKELQNEDDIVAFRNLSLNGVLYEYIKEKMCLDSRKIAKKYFFVAVFNKNRALGQSSEMQGFKTMFPNVYKIFSHIKKGDGCHNTLAIVLQKLESNFILKYLLESFKRNFKSTPYLTVHDSVITYSSKSQKLERLMKNEFLKRYGIVPVVETIHLSG